MSPLHRVTRRTFLKDLGKGVFAIAVVGPVLAACSDNDATPTTETTPESSRPTTLPPEAPPETGATSPPPTTQADFDRGPSTTTTAATTLQRIDLGFVSAYVLARGAEAAVVDTGVAGSAGEIEAGLAEIGLGWGNVGSVILTHLHPDHIGSLGDVMTAAAQADGFAGAADIPAMSSPRPLTPVGDGDTVFGLDIIETPGHTAGHICVLDPAGGILVAGDALNGSGGGVIGPNPRFSSDMTTANESVKKLAAFTFGTLVFGHGDPVTAGASDLVAALATGL